jgi:hypothetical protein
MDQHRLNLIFQTLRHVRPIQLYYQVYYRIKNKIERPTIKETYKTRELPQFTNGAKSIESYYPDGTFTFLNKARQFSSIDWNFSEYGKLWTYNLNYFDFLQQEGLSKEQGLELIQDFCSKSNSIKDGYEPYPISLRAINWVKFLSRYEIRDKKINQQLYNDLKRLTKQLEYHILANHLFENGFGLLFGAYYFRDEKLYRKAASIIRGHLKEQILSDGAHYELSPMYHNIILHRILDCYQLVSRNDWKESELTTDLKTTASKMMGWIMNMSFSNGDLPQVNDSTLEIAPKSDELFLYANELGIVASEIKLEDSGYRMYKKQDIELFIDVGQIAPSYQPGHSHADSLQILLQVGGNPIIVDTGISTYEKNDRRHTERSTSSHNTITVDNINSSEVWSGFRVGRRAEVRIHNESFDSITAEHNGYRNLGITHQRIIEKSLKGFKITDNVFGPTERKLIQGHLHFHPECSLVISENSVIVNNIIKLKFNQIESFAIQEYKFAQGFNLLRESKKLLYTLRGSCNLEIDKID